jgi:hypothetical protein
MAKWNDAGTMWLSKSGAVLVFALEQLPQKFFVVDYNDLCDLLEAKVKMVQIRVSSDKASP